MLVFLMMLYGGMVVVYLRDFIEDGCYMMDDDVYLFFYVVRLIFVYLFNFGNLDEWIL